MRVADIAAAGWDCQDAGTFTILAWLDWPSPTGWEGPWIEPNWLAYPPAGMLPALWQERPHRDAHEGCGTEDCLWFFVSVDPESGIDLGQDPRWVIVTGHQDDPRSGTCHWAGFDNPADAASYDDADAVASCRTSFIVTSIRNAESPSP